MTFTNFPFVPPPVSVAGLLAAGAFTAALLAAAGFLGLAGRSALARRLGLAAAALLSFYALLLFGLGVATPARVVPRGGEKFFCEIDCHVGYSVTDVKEGPEAGGRRVVVSLRSRFDGNTISPGRGNGPLAPNPRAAALVDRAGRRFEVEPAGARSLAAPLRPGEAYVTDLVFRVPADADGLQLSLVESDGPVRLLLGHERAPLAGETLLALR